MHVVYILWKSSDSKYVLQLKVFFCFLFNLPDDMFKDFNASEFWLYREKSLQSPCVMFCN